MPIRHIYFDLGNVLVTFDHGIACRALSELSDSSPETIQQQIYESGLQDKFETGLLNAAEFCHEFRAITGSTADDSQIIHANAAIFELNSPIVSLVVHLRTIGYRLGILSNTCSGHWDYVASGRYNILTHCFHNRILSYEQQSMKPDAKIYQVAIEQAQCDPQEIFFMDDRMENVKGAIKAGIDAVQYVNHIQLAKDLASRGVVTNL